jgi:hypothetical protein
MEINEKVGLVMMVMITMVIGAKKRGILRLSAVSMLPRCSKRQRKMK